MFQPPSAAAAPLPTGPFVAPAQAVPQQIYTPAPPASNYDFSSSGGFGAAVQPSSQPNIMVPAAPSAAAPLPVAPPPTAGGGAANPAVSDGPGESLSAANVYLYHLMSYFIAGILFIVRNLQNCAYTTDHLR